MVRTLITNKLSVKYFVKLFLLPKFLSNVSKIQTIISKATLRL